GPPRRAWEEPSPGVRGRAEHGARVGAGLRLGRRARHPFDTDARAGGRAPGRSDPAQDAPEPPAVPRGRAVYLRRPLLSRGLPLRGGVGDAAEGDLLRKVGGLRALPGLLAVPRLAAGAAALQRLPQPLVRRVLGLGGGQRDPHRLVVGRGLLPVLLHGRRPRLAGGDLDGGREAVRPGGEASVRGGVPGDARAHRAAGGARAGGEADAGTPGGKRPGGGRGAPLPAALEVHKAGPEGRPGARVGVWRDRM
ncbi:MAG: gp1, partial [uncultured Rubrobacteraceae bacterium]